MLYINDQLLAKKDPSLWKEFQDEFNSHLDPIKRERIVKPIMIKYIPALIKADRNPENKGKTQKPRSLAIKHVSQIQIGDSMVDVRYTKTTPSRNTVTGQMEYKGIQETDVYTQLGVTDIDFAFYFWAYSKQNVKNHPDAKLMIENKEKEAADLARVRRNEALIRSRLWNTVEEGGCTDDMLREFAFTRKHIYNAESMNEDQLRIAIEEDINLDKTPKSKLDFLEFTQPKLSGREFSAQTNVVAEALEHDVIVQVNIGQTFNWKKDGKTGEAIWCWKDSAAGGKPGYKFSVYLDSNPSLKAEIIAKTEEAKQVAV